MYWHKDNWEKVKRYYFGTYIKIPECATLVYVNEVGPSHVRMKDNEGNMYEVSMNNGYNLEWTLPVNRFWFQHGANAYLLVRNPQRQYFRGFSSHNTMLYKLNGDGSLKQIDLQWEVLNSVVNKLPYSGLAQNKLQEAGFSSVAISHRVAIVKNGLLYVDNKAVGIYNSKKKKITCLPVYAPILYDIIKLDNAHSPTSGTTIEEKHE